MRKDLLLACSLTLFYSLNVTAQTQLEMNEQACSKYKLADAELNRVYQQILRDYQTNTTFIQKLKSAQRAWLIYRDAQLAAIYPDPNPSTYGSVNPICFCYELQGLTLARTKELKRWIEGTTEGDVCAGSARVQKPKAQ